MPAASVAVADEAERSRFYQQLLAAVWPLYPECDEDFLRGDQALALFRRSDLPEKLLIELFAKEVDVRNLQKEQVDCKRLHRLGQRVAHAQAVTRNGLPMLRGIVWNGKRV